MYWKPWEQTQYFNICIMALIYKIRVVSNKIITNERAMAPMSFVSSMHSVRSRMHISEQIRKNICTITVIFINMARCIVTFMDKEPLEF